MGIGISDSQVDFLVSHTLAKFHKRGEAQVVWDEYTFLFLDEVFTKDRMRVQSGKRIEWRYQFEGNGSFRHKQMVQARDQVNWAPNVVMSYAEWRRFDFYVSVVEDMMDQCNSEAEIVDYLKTEYKAALLDALPGLETRAVLTPDSADDTLNPHGLAYTLRGPTAGVQDYEGGFIGQTAYYQDGASTTTNYNLDRATYEKLRNFAGTHTGPNPLLLDLILAGRLRTNYKPPRDPTGKAGDLGKRGQHRMVLWQTAYEQWYQNLVTTRFSDGRNRDVAPQGIEGFGYLGSPTRGVPVLDNQPYNPVYDVDFKHWFPAVLNGKWMAKRAQRYVEQVDNMMLHPFHGTYNYMSDHPRAAGSCFTTYRAA